jgi:hypothetical protein
MLLFVLSSTSISFRISLKLVLKSGGDNAFHGARNKPHLCLLTLCVLCEKKLPQAN